VLYRILGPLEVASEAGPVSIKAPKPRALLAVLLLHPNEAVSSERLIDELWGERPPATAPKVLQTYVSQLRRLLGVDTIVTRVPGYLLRIDTEAVDATRFRSLTSEARRQAASDRHEQAVALYGEALALWRGPALADVALESFARTEVERLEEERLAATMDLTDAELALGRHEQVVAELEARVRQYPFRERLHGQLMLALYRSGRQADALNVYQDARRTLGEELGLEPGRELQELEKAVLTHDPAVDAPPPTSLSQTTPAVKPPPSVGGMRELLSGTVTFLFSDVEGSTRLLNELGADEYATVLAEHRRMMREAFAAYGGVEVDARGEESFIVFPTAPAALAAASAAQEALQGGPVRVRMGIHTGTPLVTTEGYVGADVHRAARLAAVASGGQVVVSSSTYALAPDGLHDLGKHRFKDLGAAELVYQLGDEPFPPLRTLPETNLPVPSTPFLGRAEELGAVIDLLLRADLPLVTLTGTGGTGKTRLALQAAAEAAASFPGGVFWAGLASLADAALLPATVIRALGATDASDRHLAAVVSDRTRGAPALFLLDNCEHLLPELAAPICTLRDLPGTNVLATSRERLQLQGERVFAVPPLAEDDAVELFETRAAAVGAPPAPREEIRELCNRLDDLPLALELAAARSVLFSPAQLLARLGERLDLLKGGRDVDPRQQTLRGMIQWSHDLLSEDEQRLFRRLAVFSGGCSYEAAVAVSDADPDTLQSLLDKSLLRRRQENGESRYWMLDTLHQFAAEQLTAAGEREERRRRHLTYFLEFVYASRAVPDRQFGVLGPERANVRAAATFAIDQGDAVSLAELAWGVRHVSAHWPDLAEYHAWVAEALRAEQSLPPLLRARMRLLAGWAAWRRDMTASRRHYQAAETLYRQLGDDNGVALARCGSTEISAFEGDLETARATYEDVLADARQAHDVMVMVIALHQLARIALEQADHERAHALASEEVRLSAAEGSYPTPRMLSVLALALAELGRGNADRALHLATQSLVEAHDRGLNSVSWQSLLYLAEIALVRGADAKAAALIGHADSFAERFEFRGNRLEAELSDRLNRTLAVNLEPQTLAAAQAEGASMTTEEAVALARSLA
jgi:predicted ATPase/DNA-binding SARP family transcriptional activator/class 3 adenylate cyclase